MAAEDSVEMRPAREVRRFRPWIEIPLCVLLVSIASMFALWRMDYLSPDTVDHIRMTDSSRTAYVAKNIADGTGYVAGDMPSFLIDFYDVRGKLHDEHWVNADRFPFTAYAVAALYLVTGNASSTMGVLVYNFLWFVGTMVLIYWFARRVWGNPFSPALAVMLALLHPLSWLFLYLKDGDSLFITTACLACLYRYFESPQGAFSRRVAVALGTSMAWAFLCRPNLGVAFVFFFGLVVLKRLYGLTRERGLGPAVRVMIDREGLAFLIAAAWVTPFAVHTLIEWGSLFFSANGVYQLPLGTPYAMNTDTWWKYTEPGTVFTVGKLWTEYPGHLITKFTSSWVLTISRVFGNYYGIETLLTAGLAAYLRRRSAAPDLPADADPEAAAAALRRAHAARMIIAATAFALLVNLLILPLYGPQNYVYRHYLGFVLPMLWIAAGHALYLLGKLALPHARAAVDALRRHRGIAVLVLVLVVIAWNVSASGNNSMFANTARFLGRFWPIVIVVLVALTAGPWMRRHRTKLGVLLMMTLVLVRYRPFEELKRTTLNYFPVDEAVWDVLRERKGIVMSFATVQGQVPWETDRKHVPAPEFLMHLYSFAYDHDLEIEDVFLESAQTARSQYDGPFGYAAPGFEGYALLQKYRGRLPGYELVYHDETIKGYPKYEIKARAKASSVYRLVDRDAVRRVGLSPSRIEIGDIANLIHAGHGFEDFATVDGRPVIAATDITSRQYPTKVPRPWESSSMTFFLEKDRVPTAVDIELYAPHAQKLDFYWNLDLYEYALKTERNGHLVGTFAVAEPGWHRFRLNVPAHLVRAGLNKIGFRPSAYIPPIVGREGSTLEKPSLFRSIALCPSSLSDVACAQLESSAGGLLRTGSRDAARVANVSILVHALDFHYGVAPSLQPPPPTRERPVTGPTAAEPATPEPTRGGAPIPAPADGARPTEPGGAGRAVDGMPGSL